MNTLIVPDDNLVITYKTLRKLIGIIGTSMPLTLYLGASFFCHTGVQPSISAYYHTCMRDSFVGMLCVIGVFLFAYRGYTAGEDNLVSNLGGIFAIGAALFPTASIGMTSEFSKIAATLHLVFAFLLFATLIYFSLVLFTKTSPNRLPTGMKLKRNRVYRITGVIMTFCLVLARVIKLLPTDIAETIASYNLIFWLEAIAIISFGISWLIKGEAFLHD